MTSATESIQRGTSAHPDVPRPFLRIALRALVLAAALAAPGGWLRAQWLGDSASEALTRSGIDHIYNLELDSARTEFLGVIAAHPDHPAGHFFLAAVEWWRIMADAGNTAYDENFVGMLDRVIGLCDRLLEKDENDVAALFFKGGSLGFQGRLYGNREDWIQAANKGRVALPVVQQTYQLAPENEDVLFGIGIYNYYAAIVPEMYPFVKPLMLFFPEGDKAKGLEQLRRAAEKAKYADTEASYFLLQILFNYEKQNVEAGLLAADLHRRYPNNPLFHRYAGRTAAAVGQAEESARIFGEIVARSRSGRFGYGSVAEREARYYLGLDEMRRGTLDSALVHFYRCDELSRTIDAEKWTGFMTLANLKIGMIYDLQGKRDLALRQYEKVLEMKDVQSAHDQARRYQTSPYGKS